MHLFGGNYINLVTIIHQLFTCLFHLILSLLHCCIANHYISGIHALTSSLLYQFCHRHTIAPHCTTILLQRYIIAANYVILLVIYMLISQSIVSSFYIPQSYYYYTIAPPYRCIAIPIAELLYCYIKIILWKNNSAKIDSKPEKNL